MALHTWRRRRRRRSKRCWDNPSTSMSDEGILWCPLWYCCCPKIRFLPLLMPEFDLSTILWSDWRPFDGQCSILLHPLCPDIYRFLEQLGYLCGRPVLQVVSTAGIVFWCNCNNKLLIDHYQRINNKFSKSITWVEWKGGIASPL